MVKELVIAAYDRDYNWVENIARNVKITPYRKGSKPPNSGEILIKPNVGRDVHTFFYHLWVNYDNLADITFFSQDYPFDHVSNYIEVINSPSEDLEKYANQSKSGCWFFCTQYGVLTCTKNGFPHHPGLDLEKIWGELFNSPCPNSFQFTPTGHFAISKEYAQKIPRSRYKKILTILESQPTSPWEIERLEPYIFDVI
ncbi:DUF3431 domain-containing protein [Akkermansiaceae bacterium]|nr:DUF3431 domain-containing protein [Akkermansiaceae bacterium]